MPSISERRITFNGDAAIWKTKELDIRSLHMFLLAYIFSIENHGRAEQFNLQMFGTFLIPCISFRKGNIHGNLHAGRECDSFTCFKSKYSDMGKKLTISQKKCSCKWRRSKSHNVTYRLYNNCSTNLYKHICKWKKMVLV